MTGTQPVFTLRSIPRKVLDLIVPPNEPDTASTYRAPLENRTSSTVGMVGGQGTLHHPGLAPLPRQLEVLDEGILHPVGVLIVPAVDGVCLDRVLRCLGEGVGVDLPRRASATVRRTGANQLHPGF